MADIMKMGKNPNYLGSWDLEDLPNREVTLTIEKIIDENVVTNGKTEKCTVSHWTNKAFKPMILNPTNKKTLCKLYKTKDTELLKGKTVIIGISQIKAFGDIYDALRIRLKIPQPQNIVKPKCEICGNDINGAGSMNPVETASYTKMKYGQALCAICATKKAQEVNKNVD